MHSFAYANRRSPLRYPRLNEALREIVCQLKSANTPLLLKFLNLLSCIVRSDSSLCSFIRELIFSSLEVDGALETGENTPCQSLAGLAVHLIKENHLLGAAATAFLLDLESSFADSPAESVTDYHGSLLALLTVLQRAISSCSCSSSSATEPFRDGASDIEQLHRMRLLLRCAAMAINRLAQSVVGLDAESLEMSADQSFRLAILVQSIAQQLFAGNDVLAVITGLADESAAATSVDAKQQSPPDTINLVQKAAVLAKAGLTVECLDLMLACINHLSAVSPAPPPRSQSGIEDASETRIDSTPRLVENMTGLCLQEEASAARLRRCGDALQHFLERPVMPSLLALTLAEGDGLFLPSGAPLTCPVAAWNYSLRLSALRLLPLALQLEKFSNQAFTDTLVALLPPDLGVVDRYLTSKLQSQAQQKPDSRSPAFLTTWLLCTQPLGPSSYTESSRGNQRQSNCTEEVLEKLLSRMDGMEVSSGAVEANLNAKNEALTAALRESDQIVEQLRTRALLAEAEALRLANLQLTALTERERDRTTLADLTSQLNRLKAMNADLSNDLAAKRQDCENLLATKQNLQSKLANSREQIRALDATNDNYRKQLDEAKQLLQQKDVQIQQYTQITRLINDLTGNRAPAIDLAASIQLPNKTSSTNP
ncbi:unnamed protein product [Schistocephalus solidus]|uniref:Protein CIP2A n=1 Tax=Schistocephalus solidus TaxID=70667 RepID=A0A183T3A9_SCHSO|nr:unnamed protein product [Schistocephalus solidus]